MITAVVFAAAIGAPGADPRPAIVELARAGETQRALAGTERALADDPIAARALGLDLLRGDLLERLGQPREAAEAYARALAGRADLAPWARYRLALVQERLGHPEVAAGIVASLVAQGPPESLAQPALDLLDRSLAAGGDCRLLRGIPRERFTGTRRRQRELMDLRCLARDGRAPNELLDAVVDYLAADHADAFAWEALALLDGGPALGGRRSTALLAGLTAHRHRDFGRALELLAPWVDRGVEGPFDTIGRDAAYAAARAEFWRGRYAEAAARFTAIADGARAAAERSDAYHQLARSLELAGDPESAHAAFDRAYHESPSGDWAGASLLALLRLDAARGDGSSARRRLAVLASDSRLAALTARGAVFLAAGELARGRTSGVGGLLALAERTREHSVAEIAYWRGRLYEQLGEAERAIDEYLRVARDRPFHPLAEAAHRRLAGPALAAAANARAARLRESSDVEALWSATFLSSGRERQTDARRGVTRLAASASGAPWVAGGLLPVPEWPLWRDAASRAEDLLVALGLAELAPEAVPRAFPASRPEVGLTGASLLVDGPAARSGLAIAETIFSRRPRAVPLDWVAPGFLRTLYPRPWGELLASQAAAHGVDPHLLTAIVREESRFDPDARSPAAAQGLAQLVLPTARRLARGAGLAEIGLADLRQPAVSAALAAAYLAELARRFQGEPTAIAAAYNAGEDQTALWMRSCLSSEPEELLAKIGFGETRAYVTRVLESRNAYRLLAAAAP